MHACIDRGKIYIWGSFMLRAWNRFSLIKWNCLKFTILYQTSKKMFKKNINSILQLHYPFSIFFVDWSNTTLGASPMALNQSSMTLPYVLHEFTPNWVAILGMQYAKTCNSFFNIAYMDLGYSGSK